MLLTKLFWLQSCSCSGPRKRNSFNYSSKIDRKKSYKFRECFFFSISTVSRVRINIKSADKFLPLYTEAKILKCVRHFGTHLVQFNVFIFFTQSVFLRVLIKSAYNTHNIILANISAWRRKKKNEKERRWRTVFSQKWETF